MTDLDRSDEFLEYAKSYARAATRLLGERPLEPLLNPAFYLLIAHSLELMLKCLCLKAGVTENKIRQFGKSGHCLHAAYICAMHKEMVPNYMTPLGNLILALTSDHETYVFRYPPNKPDVIVPPPEHCVQILSEELSAVEAKFRPLSPDGLP